MRVPRSFVATLLPAAASAFGQTTVRPPAPIAAVRGAALSPAAALFAPSVALNASSPVLAAPLVTLAPTAAAAAAPVAARVAAISGALQDFSRMDLNSASSVEARVKAEALMVRALDGDPRPGTEEETTAVAGVAPTRAAALSRPRLYLLSRPLRERVELGPVARSVHVGYKVLAQAAKVWLAWTLTATPEVAVAALIYQGYRLPATLAEFTAQTAIDLSLRYWWRMRKTLRELARRPGVSRLRVLTVSRVRFSGLIARSADKEGLIFVESSQALPESVGRFGAPIPIGNLSGSRATTAVPMSAVPTTAVPMSAVPTLAFVDGRGVSPTTWTPTVSELLDGRPVPAAIAQAWRARLEESERARSKLARFLDFSKDRELRLEARLTNSAGAQTRLGAVVSGSAVRKLIGLGRLSRLPGRGPIPRAIALSDFRVEKADARSRETFVRAWRRLTGRLIVL